MEGVRRRRRADGVAGLQSHHGVAADAVREGESSTPPRRPRLTAHATQGRRFVVVRLQGPEGLSGGGTRVGRGSGPSCGGCQRKADSGREDR